MMYTVLCISVFQGSRGESLKFKRLESFLKDSHKKHRDETRLRRLKKRPPAPLPPAKNKLAFVIRIREWVQFLHWGFNVKLKSNRLDKRCRSVLVRIQGVSPKVMKVIQMLRLRQIFSGTFVNINKTSVSMMKIVEPYVAWGWETVPVML